MHFLAVQTPDKLAPVKMRLGRLSNSPMEIVTQPKSLFPHANL
jgi:hypothetical protein